MSKIHRMERGGSTRAVRDGSGRDGNEILRDGIHINRLTLWDIKSFLGLWKWCRGDGAHRCDSGKRLTAHSISWIDSQPTLIFHCVKLWQIDFKYSIERCQTHAEHNNHIEIPREWELCGGFRCNAIRYCDRTKTKLERNVWYYRDWRLSFWFKWFKLQSTYEWRENALSMEESILGQVPKWCDSRKMKYLRNVLIDSWTNGCTYRRGRWCQNSNSNLDHLPERRIEKRINDEFI